MKTINYKQPERMPLQVAAEPEVLYFTRRQASGFSITDFNALSEKLPFTQAEWSAVLHISDRTLQRYVKDQKPFDGLHAEHLYQLENMADLGLLVFGDAVNLVEWLRSDKVVLDETIGFSALQSFWGVKVICNELGRIEHGVYI
ncbi:MAG TPA: antitoxin Xre-like helix-turn-helix domain-containing protein [Dyadobacter sp.]|jgi:putative toxin-antitoxin system antitoxin component (TIGR02293 family)|nr:antitoxin Xre-like helix-turn-helix domain-containing protein [Dyadobacter sp.]